ncbi:translation initiation factor IF-2-like [Oreochromis aureus]|uniref:translation initiation factor IF-2-like n=1 Tax=Oreochromis aureus TaxID=47969 RepID=UPI001953F185|nr:translation initiation factor IF-2-like [Oreochromis aureus]
MITISYHISRTVFETLHCSNMEQDRLVGRGNLHRRGGGAPRQRGGHRQRGRGGGAPRQRGGHRQRGRGGGAPRQRGGHRQRGRGGGAPRQRGGHRQRGRGGGAPRQRGGHRQRGRGGGAQRTIISNEVRAIIVDHVVNRGFTMAEAARLVQPNLQRSTVSSIIQTFRQENRINRRQPGGGRPRVLTDQQELAVVEMVRARNDIRLSEIKQAIENSNDTFANVPSISLPTIARLLKKHQVSMKQIYLVPFERNNVRVKQLRSEYIQRVMELDAAVNHHKYIFVDEAGFNLAKTRRRGRNLIGQRATIQVPGQRGNISMCAAISEDGVLPPCTAGSGMVSNTSSLHDPLSSTIFPFLNPIEEFFSTWRWKVYDRHPHEHVSFFKPCVKLVVI